MVVVVGVQIYKGCVLVVVAAAAAAAAAAAVVVLLLLQSKDKKATGSKKRGGRGGDDDDMDDRPSSSAGGDAEFKQLEFLTVEKVSTKHSDIFVIIRTPSPHCVDFDMLQLRCPCLFLCVELIKEIMQPF